MQDFDTGTGKSRKIMEKYNKEDSNEPEHIKQIDPGFCYCHYSLVIFFRKFKIVSAVPSGNQNLYKKEIEPDLCK